MHSEVEEVEDVEDVEDMVAIGRAVVVETIPTAAAAVVEIKKNETFILHYHHSFHPFFYFLQ